MTSSSVKPANSSPSKPVVSEEPEAEANANGNTSTRTSTRTSTSTQKQESSYLTVGEYGQIPSDGMLVWLDSQDLSTLDVSTLDVSTDNAFMNAWKSKCPHTPNTLSSLDTDSIRNPCLRRVPGREGHGSTLRAINGVYFDFDHSASFESDLCNVQTICSYHSWQSADTPVVSGRSATPANFYILTGNKSYALHGTNPQKSAIIGDTGSSNAFFKEARVRVTDTDTDTDTRADTAEVDVGMGAAEEQSVLTANRWENEAKIAVLTLSQPLPASEKLNRIGADRKYHQFCGIVVELIVYNRELSSAEKTAVEKYLVAKYFSGKTESKAKSNSNSNQQDEMSGEHKADEAVEAVMEIKEENAGNKNEYAVGDQFTMDKTGSLQYKIASINNTTQLCQCIQSNNNSDAFPAEIYLTVPQLAFVERIQVVDNSSTTNNNTENASELDIDEDLLAAIERMGKTLFDYHCSGITEALQSRSAIAQSLNDFLSIQSTDSAKPDLNIYEYVENQLKAKYFKGENECAMRSCKCMAINTRNRLHEDTTETSTSTSANDARERNGETADLLLSTIHCALLHSFDSGYRLTRTERELIAERIPTNEEDDVDDEDEMEDAEEDEQRMEAVLGKDMQVTQMRETLNLRRDQYDSIRSDTKPEANTDAGADADANASDDSSANANTKTDATAAVAATATPVYTKFVTIIEEDPEEEEEEEDPDADEKSNGEPKKTKRAIKRMIGYSFGLKLYYWLKYKNNTAVDKHYNDGKYAYGDWFVDPAFASLKREMFDNRFLAMTRDAWQYECAKVETWMLTAMVKQMVAQWRRCTTDYSIAEHAPISVSHLLALAFYTNFTQLCTLFSRVFRRIPSTESNESLKERNAQFREWARHLIETISVWGTTMHDSRIAIFYHGVSIPMSFPSMFAVFCSPTSTTNVLTVAVMFATSGLVLELQNNQSHKLSYMDCWMSDFSTESEKLFMNGGFDAYFSELRFTALSFNSIRSIALRCNYKVFVIAFSSFQSIITGYNGIHNQLRSRKSEVNALKGLIRNRRRAMTAAATKTNENESENVNNESVSVSVSVNVNETENPALFYVQSMFDNYLDSLEKIQIFVPVLNISKWNKHGNPLFVKYRKLFCETHSKEVLEAKQNEWSIQSTVHEWHERGFVNPIKSVRMQLLLDLCPRNLQCIEILQLSLRREFMQQLLALVIAINRQNVTHPNYYAIERFLIGYFQSWTYGYFHTNCYCDWCCVKAEDEIESICHSYADIQQEYEAAFAEQQWKIAKVFTLISGLKVTALEITKSQST